MPIIDSDASFIRRRRNFIFTSSILAVVGGAGIKVEALPVLANVFDVHNTWVAYVFLWLWGIYSGIAFAIYLYACRFNGLLASLVIAKRNSVRRYLHLLGDKTGVDAERTETFDEVSVWPVDVDVEVYKYFAPDDFGGGGSQAGRVVEQKFVRINKLIWASLVLRGIVKKFVFGFPVFEYVFPVLWFVVAVILASRGSWEGTPPSIWGALSVPPRPAEYSAGSGGLQQKICDWRSSVPARD